MKKFIKNVLLFFVPIILLLSLYAVGLINSGELLSMEDIADKMVSGDAELLGFSYRNDSFVHKHLVASRKSADLLVLGTSRAMQFHDEFFTDLSFYNAGGSAAYLSENLFFLQNLPQQSLPSILILVTDQNFYNEVWSGDVNPDYSYTPTAIDAANKLSRLLGDFYKVRLDKLIFANGDKIGVAANIRGSGFNRDGSYNYGEMLTNPKLLNDKNFAETFTKIKNSTARFEQAEEIYTPSLDETEKLLSFCNENNIQVVGILPPYAPSVINEMRSSGQYGYIDKLYSTLLPMYTKYGFELYDYSFLENSKDEQFIDGYHGSDRVYAQITLELADKSQSLAPFIKKPDISQLLQDTGNPLTINFPVKQS
ncbi:MAG: hypothetical protein RR508_00135 [Oscillospiraceae bacterium]